jgi:putative ABC transport system permease protein
MNRMAPSIRLASGIVRAASRLVPRSYRARWLEEWLGEIEQAEPGRIVLARSLGAFSDAFACRRVVAGRVPADPVTLERRGLMSDVRFAVRMVGRTPGFTLAAVASLSIGIAATTTVFSAFNALLFRSLPGVAESGRLVHIFEQAPGLGGVQMPNTAFELYRESMRSFSGVAAFAEKRLVVGRAKGAPSSVRALLASDRYFEVLGTKAAVGRLLDASTAHDPVVVVSQEFARRELGGVAPSVGQAVTLNGHPFQVVGVAPSSFGGIRPGDFGGDAESRPQLWIPLAMGAAIAPEGKGSNNMNRSLLLDEGSSDYVFMFGRLRAGVTFDSARAQVAAVPARPMPGRAALRLGLTHLGRGPHDSASVLATIAVLIMAIPLTVLAIGCANTANLQLARAVSRQSEIAVRRSLGASRGHIVRQLLVESLLVAVLAGAVGIAATLVLTKVFAQFVPVPFPVDWRVLTFAAAIISATGLGVGMVPALRATAGDLTAPLRGSGGAPLFRRSRLRSALVVAQIALSLVLLVMSALFVRSLQRLNGLDVDRNLSEVATATINLAPLQYDETRGLAFQQELVARLERAPGVVTAAVVPFQPFGQPSGLVYNLPGRKDPMPYRFAQGGAPLGRFLETAGLRVLRGRNFSDADRIGTPKVVIISESVAQQIAPSGNAIGERLLVNDGGQPAIDVTVVGITPDTRLRVGTQRPEAMMFLPSPLRYDAAFSVWVRAAGDAEHVLPHIRRVVNDLDARLPMQLATAEALRYEAVGPIRWIAGGLAAMGTVAVLLAGAGLYAVISFLVAHRRHELAIRLALGATRAHLIRLVVGDSARLSLTGVIVGAFASAVVARLARALLVGVSPFDPVAFSTVSAVLIAIALAATVFPALRASRLDPLTTLRRQ